LKIEEKKFTFGFGESVVWLEARISVWVFIVLCLTRFGSEPQVRVILNRVRKGKRDNGVCGLVWKFFWHRWHVDGMHVFT